jgi:hypothetical protein
VIYGSDAAFEGQLTDAAFLVGGFLAGQVLARFIRVFRTSPAAVLARQEAKISKYWPNRIVFQGNTVYQRNDLVDPFLRDALGRPNLQRMEAGLAPLGPDKLPINLHHMLQTQSGPLVELTQSFHMGFRNTIHINPRTIPSGIDRVVFAAWRADYWKNRVRDFR